MATSLELKAQRAQLVADAAHLNDTAAAESRDLTAEEQANFDAATARFAELTKQIQRAEFLESTAATEARAFSPIEGPDRADGPTDQAERREQQRSAFHSWVRYGFGGVPEEQRMLLTELRGDALSGPEARALGINVATGAGYMAPDETRRSIEQAMAEFGGMRSVAEVFATSDGRDLRMLVSNDTSNTGELVAEHQAVTTQDASVGLRVLRAYMYSSKRVLVSIELLQDSVFDIEAWLRGLFAERIGRITNTHFTTGAGGDRPTGITIDSVLGTTAASQTAITWDELKNHPFTIDRAYRDRGRWMFHSNTLRDILGLTDGNGLPLWGFGANGGIPDRLFNYPYTVNDDMPTMATGNRAILFGDLRKYMIRDVSGFRLLRLEELYAENGQVAFLAYSRHDGMLMDAGTNPVKHVVMA